VCAWSTVGTEIAPERGQPARRIGQQEQYVIGMLHVPINTILTSAESLRAALGLPAPHPHDWEVIAGLGASLTCRHPVCDWTADFPSLTGLRERLAAAGELVRTLSFYRFLEDRMVAEAEIYARNGVHKLMLENTGGPYFVGADQPRVIFALMSSLAAVLREAHPLRPIGIQILAFADNLALDIAVHHGLSFVRTESALFSGLRPEGLSPNRGNLAKLCMARGMLLAGRSEDTTEPAIYVDIHKKHTIFPALLDSPDVWLENILFQKLEGIIITGRATGSPVDESVMALARKAIEQARIVSAEAFESAWAPGLLVGSGVSVDNIRMCRKHADGVIVGSSLKRAGYWECPLDVDRVKRFMDAWHA